MKDPNLSAFDNSLIISDVAVTLPVFDLFEIRLIHEAF